MTTYRSAPSYLDRQLSGVATKDLAAAHLQLDIGNLLIGPTSGEKARHIASSLVSNNDPEEVALRMVEIGLHYLGLSIDDIRAPKAKRRKPKTRG